MKNPLKTLAALTLGYAGGLLLAKKTGKTLRKEIVNSENPAKAMFNAMKDADLAAFEDFKDWWKNSEKVKSMLAIGKKHFENIAEEAKKYGKEAMEKTTEELERVAKEAQETAEELKKTAVKKSKEIKKDATKKTKKFKNELERKTRTIAKKLKK